MRLEGTVHVVDDDTSVLSALRWLLESVPLGVETYANGKEFLERYDGDGPACVVLDLSMPEMTGLELQEAMASRHWTLPIIFLSGHARVSDAVTALRQGAVDFLEKPFKDDELLERIRMALDNDRAARAKAVEEATHAVRLAALTKRERQVVTRVAAGLPNKVIAMELGISPRTVEVYRAQGMRKTGARSLAELVQLVLESRDRLEA